MPVHDWTRVEAGTFHAFHTVWIGQLMIALNAGLLPKGYYALAEQHAGQFVPDVLTLREPAPESDPFPASGGALALAEAPPRLRRTALAPEDAYRRAQRTLAIRRERGHRLVALVEIVSPGNKDRDRSVEDFVDKIEAALGSGCHVVVVDLFPPGPHDPGGMHHAIWGAGEVVEDATEGADQGAEGSLTLASYVAERFPSAYVATLGVGDALPEMPLFLTPDVYVPLPLEATYQAAYHGMPAYWRGVIEGPAPA